MNQEFGPETWKVVPSKLFKWIFWDEYYGVFERGQFSFWDIDNYPRTGSPKVMIEFPIHVDYVTSNQKFLAGGSKTGTIGIYQKDGSFSKTQIFVNLKDKISHIYLHNEYLLVTVNTYDEKKTYVFNLENGSLKKSLRGSFEMMEEDAPYLSGKYAIKWSPGMDLEMNILDLDTIEEFPISKEFEEVIYPLSKIPIFISLGEELIGYRAPTGEQVWKFPYPVLTVFDLQTNAFVARSDGEDKYWLVNGETGEIMDTFEISDVKLIIPIHTPTRTKYLIHKWV